MQAFTCNGLWWLPGSPAKKVAGTLQFADEDGASVSLAGVLGEPVVGLQEKRVPIILGLVWDCPLGSSITLKECRVKNFRFGSVGIAREDYFADRLFAGAHLEQDADFSFTDLSISLSGLSSWAESLSGLSFNHLPKDEKHHGGFEVRWLPPQPIRGALPGGSFILGVGATFSHPRREFLLAEQFSINVSCEEPQTVEDLNARYVYPLQNLMTLATDHPNALVEFKVRRPNSRDDVHVRAAWVFHDASVASNLLPYQVLFTLEDVKDRDPDLINRWIQISDRLRGVCNPYFGIQYKPDSFVDTRFLTVFQSLEAYLRRRGPAANLGSSPSGFYLEESFAQLVEEHKETAGPLFGIDTASTIADVMKYRNYVVHGNSGLGDSPTYGVLVRQTTSPSLIRHQPAGRRIEGLRLHALLS
jgi:hypothetical protein